MKANPRRPHAPAFRHRQAILAGAALLGALIVAGCGQKPAVAPPPPAPVATPRPVPVLPRATVDWRRAPLTPGDWRWTMEGGASVARFAGGQLVLRCDLASRNVTLLRAGIADTQVPMSISTSALTRPLMASPVTGAPPALAVNLAPRDPLLDAMAFSRGRFAVETAGLPTLYVPSWVEVSRVIEDCR